MKPVLSGMEGLCRYLNSEGLKKEKTETVSERKDPTYLYSDEDHWHRIRYLTRLCRNAKWDTFLDGPILAVMDTHLRAQDISKLLFVIHVQRTTRNVLMTAVHLLLDSILNSPCSRWVPEVLLYWLPSACIANTHYQILFTWALERKSGTVLSYLLSLTQGHIFDNI